MKAIIDNFSRKILAHAVSDTKTAEESSLLVREACASLGVGSQPLIIADDGGENCADNPSIASALLDTGSTMAIAGVDLLCSNSMIERFWMQLKHNYLFTQRLDSMAALRRFVDFFAEQHNEVIPHSAFNGQTPAEVFLGAEVDLPQVLADKRLAAKEARVIANRAASCGLCPATRRPPAEHVP